ncbi:hypothetical protein [uncultured Fibrobacter sp.]|uniref:hypothetical protein n=1 Tax=uncultured Fibrobacter sp. TaxID=261512 RepID=UPI0025CFF5A0|nr:hypothetical protein [uncultured Fibrobacter sp.]
MGHAVTKNTKYQIVDARVEVCSGGPDPSILVAEVELMPQTAKGKPVFYTLSEAEGMPAFYKTKESVFDKLMNPDEDEDVISDIVNKHTLYEGESYADFFENHKGIECYEGLRYLIYVMRASWDDAKAFIEGTKGKNLSEIEIPKSDAEEDWENGEEDW